MAIASAGPLNFVARVVTIVVFVFLTTPFGPLQHMVVPEKPDWPSIPVILCLMLVLCMHVYLLYRAYYALKFVGIAVLTAFYGLLAYYLASLFGAASLSLESLRWHTFFYLSLLYTYGICFSFIDAYISGLLHTKNV